MLWFHRKIWVGHFLIRKLTRKRLNKNPENWQCAIWYFSKSSDVPYSPNQFLDFFPTSYSKPALVINLGTAATSSQRSPSGSQLLHHWRSTGYTTYMTFIFDFLLQPWYDFQYIITLCPLFFIVSSLTILMIMIYFFISYNKKIVQNDLNLWQKKSRENEKEFA